MKSCACEMKALHRRRAPPTIFIIFSFFSSLRNIKNDSFLLCYQAEVVNNNKSKKKKKKRKMRLFYYCKDIHSSWCNWKTSCTIWRREYKKTQKNNLRMIVMSRYINILENPLKGRGRQEFMFLLLPTFFMPLTFFFLHFPQQYVCVCVCF